MAAMKIEWWHWAAGLAGLLLILIVAGVAIFTTDAGKSGAEWLRVNWWMPVLAVFGITIAGLLIVMGKKKKSKWLPKWAVLEMACQQGGELAAFGIKYSEVMMQRPPVEVSVIPAQNSYLYVGIMPAIGISYSFLLKGTEKENDGDHPPATVMRMWKRELTDKEVDDKAETEITLEKAEAKFHEVNENISKIKEERELEGNP